VKRISRLLKRSTKQIPVMKISKSKVEPKRAIRGVAVKKLLRIKQMKLLIWSHQNVVHAVVVN
jgi:hypothetical protein